MIRSAMCDFQDALQFVIGCSPSRRRPVFARRFNRLANVSPYGTQRLLALRPIDRALGNVPVAMFL